MIETLATALIARLLTASVQGGLVVALVWIVCRAVPAIPVSVRTALWWLATLKLLVAVAPVPSLDVPILPVPAPAAIDEALRARASTAAAVARSSSSPGTPGGVVQPPDATPAGVTSGRWRTWLALTWFGFVIAQAGRLLREGTRLRRATRESMPWPDDDAELARLSAQMGLSRLPRVVVARTVDGPQVTGIWRPVVLMPESIFAMSGAARTMALCHELAHIRRRDVVLGWVPALAERLFFFHPLARLAAREYAIAREAACDAAVVHALGVAPREYGRLLVHLGVAPSRPVLAASGAPSSTTSLRRRLEMLQHIEASSARAWRWGIVAFLLALLPLQLVAGTAAPPESAAGRSVAQDAPSPSPSAAPAAQGQQPIAAPARPVEVEQDAARRAERAEIQRALEAAARDTERLQEALSQDGELRRELLAAVEHASRLELDAVTQAQLERSAEKIAAELDQRLEVDRETMRAIEQQGRREQLAIVMEQLAEERARVQEIESRSRQLERERLAEQRAGGDASRSQLEQLSAQQEILAKQFEQLVAQQERIAAAQEQLAEQAEKIRRAIEMLRAK